MSRAEESLVNNTAQWINSCVHSTTGPCYQCRLSWLKGVIREYLSKLEEIRP